MALEKIVELKIGGNKIGSYVQALKYQLDHNCRAVTIRAYGKAIDKIRAIVDIVKNNYYPYLQYGQAVFEHVKHPEKDFMVSAAIVVVTNNDQPAPLPTVENAKPKKAKA